MQGNECLEGSGLGIMSEKNRLRGNLQIALNPRPRERTAVPYRQMSVSDPVAIHKQGNDIELKTDAGINASLVSVGCEKQAA